MNTGSDSSLAATSSRFRLTARRGFASVLCLAALCSVLTACSVDTGVQPGMRDTQLPYPRITITDPELQRALAFDEPIVVRDEEGFISRVEVTVRTAAGQPYYVDWRGRFMDPTGIVIQPEPSWKTRTLEPRIPEKIVLLPTARNATDWDIQFRWSR